ncbi:hypothetical protein [Actinocrispum wychmicini]|uniref:Uncharacterized protein n=1 Tax=Actinocrispum wychmicini TaxID=1213861 RepID=A0A4V2S6E1_9PSEU|nr:hypothetical protein [Actinocrispum wychmicini]TCO55690.1 hypothetical protein EV192_107112 [Actinocrispum wychmicini]
MSDKVSFLWLMFRRILSIVVGVSTAFVLTHAVAAADTRARDGKYCAIRIGKAPAGQTSPVLAKACSDVSIKAAQATMNTQYRMRMGDQGKVATAGIPIMYWYEHINYNDQGRINAGFAIIEGGDGPCDAAGYRVDTDFWWARNVSSVIGNNHCLIAHVVNRAQNDADDFTINWGERGLWLERFNDNVDHFQIHA